MHLKQLTPSTPSGHREADRVTESAGESRTKRCRVCGCSDDDCLRCMLRTGEPCWWFEPDRCSACV